MRRFIAILLSLPVIESAITCGKPLDLMFLQDTTGSYSEDLPIIMNQLESITAAVLSEYGNTRFGVAEFRDKPYFPLGQADDFCYKLNTGSLTHSLSDFYWAYSGLMASGGADAPEASFQALINVALDPAVGWSPNNGQRSHVVILNTDAVPHLPGDMQKYPPEQYPEVPQGLPPNSGVISTGDVNYECLFQDYPSAEQVKTALASRKITLIIFTPNEYANVTSAWRWVNDQLLEQAPEYYQFIQNDSSDMAEKILSLLNIISPECPVTTPEPVTTLKPTTASESSAGATPAGTASATDSAAASATESATTTQSEVATDAGSGEATCPCPAPCPPPCGNPCCNENEIMIILKHKPAHLHMEVRN